MDDEAQRLMDEAFERGVDTIHISRGDSLSPFRALVSVHRQEHDGDGRSASQSVSIHGRGESWLAALRDAMGKLAPLSSLPRQSHARVLPPAEPRMAVAGRPARRRVS